MYWKWLIWQQTTSDLCEEYYAVEHPSNVEYWAEGYINQTRRLLEDDAKFWRWLETQDNRC